MKKTEKTTKKLTAKTVKKETKDVKKTVKKAEKATQKDTKKSGLPRNLKVARNDNNKKIKVLFASAEVAPFSKVGGLADVVGSLPKELDKLGVETEIFTPYYGQIDREKYNIKFIEDSELTITFGSAVCKFTLSETTIPDTDIKVYFVDNYKYFSWFYDVYPKWLDWRFEHEKYVAFSMAVLEYAKRYGFKPDIIHTNDWHTAIMNSLLISNYNQDPFYFGVKTVFSIHNLAYQGTYYPDILDFANVQKHKIYNEWGIEHYGMVNWMKGAINYADKIIVVSPRYAQEIMTGEYGEGMDYTLRGKADKLTGILNGVDYDYNNPETDKNLVKNYSVDKLELKEECKKDILKYVGLEYNPERPLIALISRLVPQKGIDLIRDMQYELMNLDADFIFLGSGDKSYENLFIWLSNNSRNIRCITDYSPTLSSKIYAGADLFLMPSKFEPCGLSQLIAMKYGTLPIVRATGGLDNTVVGYPLNDSTGFKFWQYNGWDMLGAIKCALEVYKDKYTFNAMRKTAMKKDFSWHDSAVKYKEVYESLLK